VDMRCFICNESSTSTPFTHGGQSFDCYGCGAYSISGTTLHLCQQELLVFDVERSRDWLANRRNEGQERPIIQALNELLILHR